ncbi:alpha,alpha-trehalose-phosphate synthase (UDP-forming) [Paractinoplanes hotanensis]|uniref:Trehalose-6-phosphate synthase n=1 Tax=Paractinoplanes hotanensis TaxID=2906497 RepID=A0ABT0Y6C1_9ACTN|nr:trehalose-6-phosphate synthase [Actinoplanes hotanensis]MCM4081576.1 trehalose-6-phosphate synthase [Actinoplanes hotanensis]
MRQSSLVVVANRLPLDDNVAPDGACEWRRSPGGLAGALHAILEQTPATWVGWSGAIGEAPRLPDIGTLRLRPMSISEDELRGYYEGFANSTLWPLYHDAVEQPVFDRGWWETYRSVNRRFAEAAAEVAEPGATVWVQDYHLQLVPQLLREMRPDVVIGFFLHVPFPPPELFMQLPRRLELLRGMLGADLVGFQRPQAAHNVAQLAAKLLGAHGADDAITMDASPTAPPATHNRTEGQRIVRTGAFPVSIDVAEMRSLNARPYVVNQARRLQRDLGSHKRVLLSVDRLDYTKGIEHRLTAYSELLRDGLVKVRDVVMVQVAVPSRERVENYRGLRDRIEREVGRINGEYGRVGEPAIHYLNQPFDRADLAALYQTADVMVVTPLRDGMNLVAKEFVAARRNDTGALVLSEFAGAAAELEDAFLVNPHDVDGLKETLLHALAADPADLAARMKAMRAYITANDIHAWARAYLTELDLARPLVS